MVSVALGAEIKHQVLLPIHGQNHLTLSLGISPTWLTLFLLPFNVPKSAEMTTGTIKKEHMP